MAKLLFTDPYDSRKTIIEHADYIAVRGGDGTLLTAINDYYDLHKPFFGIAGGTVNFLMNTSAVLAPTATTLTLPVIRADVKLLSGAKHTIYAFNDFIIGNFGAWISFDCYHRDNQLGKFRGAGIIISTAAGSTGINRNNNGTTLALDSSRWAVTGMQTNRAVNSVIKPSPLKIECESRGNIVIMADGTNGILHDVESVNIIRGGSVKVIINELAELQAKRQ